MEIKGRITKILPVEEGTSKAGKPYKKQMFVIDTGDQFNPEVAFSLFGDEKVDNLAKYNSVGMEVEVSFNLSSREFNGKYYHSIDAWKIMDMGVMKAGNEEVAKPKGGKAKKVEDEDDLPF